MGGGAAGGGPEVANGFEYRAGKGCALVFLCRGYGVGGQSSSSWQTRGRHAQRSQNRVVAVEDPRRAVRGGGAFYRDFILGWGREEFLSTSAVTFLRGRVGTGEVGAGGWCCSNEVSPLNAQNQLRDRHWPRFGLRSVLAYFEL